MRGSLVALAFGMAAIAGPAWSAPFDLEYKASVLNVVELGRITLKGNIAPAGYNAAATVQTSGLAALFDDTRINASAAGSASPSGLSWSSYRVSHSYAKKHRDTTMSRSASGVVATIKPTYANLGDPPATAAQKNAARDPVTSLTEMSRSVAASGKCAGTFPVFDGKQYYTLSLSPKANGTYEGGGYKGKALVCALRYTPFAGFKMTAAEKAKIPTAEIWFATAKDGFSAPLRIEVPTPMGPARLDLAKGTGV